MSKVDLSVIGTKTEPIDFEYTWRLDRGNYFKISYGVEPRQNLEVRCINLFSLDYYRCELGYRMFCR